LPPASPPRPSYPPWLDHPSNIWRRVQVMKFLIMQSSPVSRHFLPLRSIYSPQHPVLKHPQPMLLPCDRPTLLDQCNRDIYRRRVAEWYKLFAEFRFTALKFLRSTKTDEKTSISIT
jgi:hypothetical protein